MGDLFHLPALTRATLFDNRIQLLVPDRSAIATRRCALDLEHLPSDSCPPHTNSPNCAIDLEHLPLRRSIAGFANLSVFPSCLCAPTNLRTSSPIIYLTTCRHSTWKIGGTPPTTCAPDACDPPHPPSFWQSRFLILCPNVLPRTFPWQPMPAMMTRR